MRFTIYFVILILSAGCVGRSDTETHVDVVSAEEVRNEERCGIDQAVLISCEYESWGKNKVILRADDKALNYSDISNKEVASKLELDGKFPSPDYAIGHIKKDLIYKRLEKSGYCAYSGTTTPRSTSGNTSGKKSEKTGKQKTLTVFVPASLLSGLLEDGTVFVRWWKPKKTGSSKHKTDEEITPLAERSFTSYEEQVAKCVVQSRGDEKPEEEPAATSDEKHESTKSDELKPEY